MKLDIFRHTRLALLFMLCVLTIFGMASAAASADLVWQKCLGGSSWDYANSIQQTTDGGYIVAGFAYSNDGDVSGNHGADDCWIVKLDGAGNITWQKCLGGSFWDEAYSIQQTPDGGYIVAGYASSNNGNVSGNHGAGDYWIVKLDGAGNIGWQKCLGGGSVDVAYSVKQTTDGGYIVAGFTYSNDGDVSGNHGRSDYWLVKLDGAGNIAWQKCLGGSSEDEAWSTQQTADGGYIVAGYTYSNDGNVSGNHGADDYWIVKLDGAGNITWQKCLGGSSGDEAFSIQQTIDGGYIVAGDASSNDGNVSGNHGGSDYWVLKLGKLLGGFKFDTGFMDSYEDLLRSQFGHMGSFENLLKNTTLNSSMSYKYLDSFDDLSDRQQRGLYSFEDLVSSSWSELNVKQKIKLTDSYEDLLRRQAAVITSNEDLLKRDFCILGAENKKRLLDRFEERVKFEVVLLRKFEDWLRYQQMIEDTEYDSWIAFLSSFEDLIRRQSNLLDSFETLMKIDCNDKYINVTKSADSLHVQAGNPVTYTYTVTATNSDYDVEDIIVKDSIWGKVGTIALLKGGTSQQITVTKTLSCSDCNNCTCKVCNFVTACGEAITPNGNFTVCDVSNDLCAVVSEGTGRSPIYSGRYVARAATEEARAFEETGSSGKWAKGDNVQVTLYFNR
jgi:hypothetical protein